MNTTKNLMGHEAVEKLRSLTDETPTCMFGSGLQTIPFHVCPMQVQEVDDRGNLWFFSGADSTHNRQLGEDSRAHLIFSNHQKVEYVTVFGEVTITTERERIERLS
jgi:general stress protein 26